MSEWQPTTRSSYTDPSAKHIFITFIYTDPIVRWPISELLQDGSGGGPHPPKPTWQPVSQKSEVLPQKL